MIGKGGYIMALADYECKECEKQFEIYTKPENKEPAKCPYCGKELKKLLTFNGLIRIR